MDKKELERLRIEVARVKKELDREMSQEFLSPTSEGDPQIPPMSPILKSPSIDVVAVSLNIFGPSFQLFASRVQVTIVWCLVVLFYFYFFILKVFDI